MTQIGLNSIMCYYRGDIFILHSPQIENLGNFGLKILGILHLNIQSTVSQVPMDFILFIAVSIFRVAHRATALHSDKAVENSFS